MHKIMRVQIYTTHTHTLFSKKSVSSCNLSQFWYNIIILPDVQSYGMYVFRILRCDLHSEPSYDIVTLVKNVIWSCVKVFMVALLRQDLQQDRNKCKIYTATVLTWFKEAICMLAFLKASQFQGNLWWGSPQIITAGLMMRSDWRNKTHTHTLSPHIYGQKEKKKLPCQQHSAV